MVAVSPLVPGSRPLPPLPDGFHLNAHGTMGVPQGLHRRSTMNLRKCALLLIVAIFTLANVAAAQSAKTKSKSKAKKSSKATKTAPVIDAEPPIIVPSQPITSPAAAEQKTEGEVARITVDELKEKLAKNAPVFIIDSRSQGSYDSSEMKIKGAVRIPADEIEARLKEIPRDREIVVYCT